MTIGTERKIVIKLSSYLLELIGLDNCYSWETNKAEPIQNNLHNIPSSGGYRDDKAVSTQKKTKASYRQKSLLTLLGSQVEKEPALSCVGT